MFDLDLRTVTAAPFPHVLVDDYLDQSDYGALLDTFPVCPPNSGPTGYSCFRGDADYDALIARLDVWRRLHEATQSDAFVAFALAQFRRQIELEARLDLSRAYFADYLESRADKERPALPPTTLPPEALFVRPDILQGNVGYDRRPHVDHRRRLATMLLYICDGDEDAMVGGDLVLHDRHGGAVTIRPRHNRMVMFPCVNASIHSVSPIISQTAPRNFVQISVSSTVDVWRKSARERFAAVGSRLRAVASHR